MSFTSCCGATAVAFEAITFREYVQNDDAQKVAELYKKHPDPTFLLITRDSDNRTPLHIAAELGYPTTVKFLIEKMKENSLSLEEDCGSGKTPLYMACMQGYLDNMNVQLRQETIQHLLEAGANPNAVNEKTRMTCLHWACYYPEDVVTVKRLTQANASIFAIDVEELTPIDIAGIRIKKGSSEVLDYLLEHAEKYVNDSLDSARRKENPLIIPMDDKPDTTVTVKSDLNNYSLEKKYYLDLLYWAAYRNKVTLVKKLIGLGISPFLRYFKKESAVVAAIKGGALETIKLIFTLRYESADGATYDIKEEGGNAVDKKLNTVLHIAAIENKYEIYDYLKAATSQEDKRNLKGFLPIEINSKVDAPAPLKEPEYLFIVAKDHKEMFKTELERAKLYIVEYPSLDPSIAFLTATVPEDVYRETATLLKMEAEIKESGTMLQYNEQFKSKYYPFTQPQKHQMIEHLIDLELDVKSYMENMALIDYFPLHNSFKDDIEAAWSGTSFLGIFFNWLIAKKTEKLVPIFLVASYFGEKIGMYFAWLTFYTSWLLYISVAGIVVSIFQLSSMSIDHYLIPLYCLLLSLWITVMNQMWRRREAELAHLWNMTYFRRKGTERREYQFECIVHSKTADIRKKPFVKSTVRALCFSAPMIVFGLALIAAAFIGFRIWSNVSTSFENSILVGTINGIAIFVLNYLYLYIAAILTDLENHRFENDWENSYIVKIFGFQFVNCYISLFAIAFYDADLTDLAYTVGAIFVAKQFLAHLFQLTLPGVYDWWKMRVLNKRLATDTIFSTDEDTRRRNIHLEANYIKSVAVDPIFDYCEMIIQIGYLTMFSSALPISPLFAFFRNLLEVRGEIQANLNHRRRPVADGARNIGAWGEILEFMAIISTVVNCGVVYFTSVQYAEVFSTVFGLNEILHMFYVVIGFEHALLTLKWIINWVIQDVPKSVEKDQHIKSIMNEKMMGTFLRQTTSPLKRATQEDNRSPIHEKRPSKGSVQIIRESEEVKLEHM